jgi:hypothetical protein
MKDSIEERIIDLQNRKSLQAKGVMQKLKADEKWKATIGGVSRTSRYNYTPLSFHNTEIDSDIT